MGGSGRRTWRAHVPRVTAVVLTLLGLFSAIQALSLPFRKDVQTVRDILGYLLIPASANLGYAVALFVLAAAIARRKRMAWRILLWVIAIQGVLQLLAGVVLLVDRDALARENVGRTTVLVLTIASGVVSAAAYAVLLAARREFFAPVLRGSFRRAAAVTGLGLVLATLLGWGLVSLVPGSLRGGAAAHLAYAGEKVLGGAFRFDYDRSGHPPGWVPLLLGALGGVALLMGFASLLRSQDARAMLEPESEQRIRGLLARYGERDSLGYFATGRDKAAVFSPSGKSAVTYRVVNGVSLASADPVGDVEAWGPAIDAWLEQAKAHAWVPAAMGASEEGAVAYQRGGLKVLELGDEAVLHTDRFTLDGRDMRPVRQAVNRLERAGYTVAVTRHGDLSEPELAAAVVLAEKWRDTDNERGFSMALGRLGDPSDGACVLVLARDGNGDPTALLSLSPWGTTGLSLDLMRRAPDADNGVMELMVSALMQQAPRLGVNRVSLNFAMFRAVFEEGARIGAGPILRLWRRTLLFFSRWWQLESLYRSNTKYHPEWIPRYLCFGERRELAKIGIASAMAEGFISLPWQKQPRLSQGGPAITAATFIPDVAAGPVPVIAGPEPVADDRPEQERVRRAKLDALRRNGVDPYPVSYPRTDGCGELAVRYAQLAPDTATGEPAAVTGRVMLARDHGGLAFATLRDWTGDVQVMIAADADTWARTVDIGDHVGVTGEVITTRSGEVTVKAQSWAVTAKCLHPLPDKHRGLTDPEARVRQRYVDLAINPDARRELAARGAAVHSLRQSLINRRFLEVETPILQRIHGGANARPFTTHINAYHMRLYLRIAPELYLKRLLVGGVDRVFELGRNFRNEGVDFKHNPEFTSLEAYQVYADYRMMLTLTREIIQEAAIATHGSAIARRPDGEPVDLSGEWPVQTVNAAISAALGEPVDADTELPRLFALCERAGIAYDPKWARSKVITELYDELVEARTTRPTFYTDFPTETSPLTRQHRTDPRLAERWDLVAFGSELGTAYSELIDPDEQRRRLTAQSLLAAGGDPEAMELDEDFLTALEYAMPPTGGLGIGVDRIVMLLTGKSIRETLAFPMVRPNTKPTGGG